MHQVSCCNFPLRSDYRRWAWLLSLLLLPGFLSAQSPAITGELRQWHDVTLTFDGPQASETGSPNPFLDYRLDVTFTQGSLSLVVPGYFAADGNAANSSANSGNKWRVHFRPPLTGAWNYTASFRQGTNVAVAASATAGTPASFNGSAGSFAIAPTNKTGPDLRAKGTLRYAGARYLQFQGTGEYFVKAGADAPENFLAYWEFDNTTDNGGSSNSLTSTSSYTVKGQTFNFPGDGLHHYSAHAQHWSAGDPTWGSGKGKNIIGAVNYLASTGCNVFSFLTNNINGDGRDVHPYVTYNGGAGAQADRLKFDVSKLAQWEIVFTHGEELGMFLHFKLNETENDDMFDGSFTIGNERKIYFREMVARFGHHLALNWNLGEEFGGSNGSIEPFKSAIASYAQYIRSIDPYGHPVVVHNWAGKENVRFDPHAGNQQSIHGISLQQDINTIHSKTVNYVNMSQNAGYPWIVSNDEQGPAHIGVEPDNYNNGNNNQTDARHKVLWGNLMGGGAGVEYYFGYSREHDDLESESWEARDQMWKYNKHALNFFYQYLPFWQMAPSDALVGNSGNSNSLFCFAKKGEVYAVYLPTGSTAFTLDLESNTGGFEVKWYDPRNGGALVNGSVTSVSGGGKKSLGTPPNNANLDWVILVTKSGAGGGNPVPPTVNLTAPTNNANFTAGTPISLTATASDPDGTVSKIEFFQGTTLLGSDATAPYQFTWTNATPGNYNLKAVATDNSGLTGTSSVVAITVVAASTPVPPVVALTAPTNNANFTAGTAISLTATASDPDGTVSKVEFFQGTTLLGSDATAPYQYSWTNATPGNYAIKAVATDNSGLTATSSVANIVVNPSGTGGGGTGGGGAGCPAPFAEQNGMVIIEAESATPVGSWTLETAIPGYTGSGYYVWNGADYFNAPGNGLLEYKVQITTPGTYKFVWRNRIAMGTSTSDFNDNWLRIPDASDFWAEKGGAKLWPKGSGKTPNPAGAGADGWFKIYVSEINIWSWQTRTNDGNPYEVFASFDTPGVYTIQVSARSKGHGIDRLVMFHSSVNQATATNAALGETLCQGGGGSVAVAPQVSLTAPTNGTSFQLGTAITLSANASDADGTVAKVDFLLNGITVIGTDNTAPYSINWTPGGAATYNISARATDNSGLSSTSSVATITVLTATAPKPPVVTLTSPANNTQFPLGNNIQISATASDQDGSVVKVEFWEGTNLLATDASAPYSFLWTSPVAGSYQIKAVAVDNSNLSASSAVVNVTVAGQNKLPSVAITSPAANASFVAGSPISITASASDTDGSVVKVEFYAGNLLIGTDQTAPFAATWSNATAGTHLLRAVATDNQGGSANSAQVSIVVTANGGGGTSGKPVVELIKPLNGATFAKGSTVNVEATATDSDGTIAQVEFFLNGNKFATQKVAAYRATLKNVQPGTYTLMAVGTDNQGNKDSSIVQYTVTGGSTTGSGPDVQIIEPLDGAVFNPGDDVAVEATATDANGSINRVEFFTNGVKWRTEKVAPYTGEIQNVQPGTYVLMAIAFDNDAFSDTSIITFTVTGGAPVAPNVSIISPVSGTELTEGASTDILVDATDPDGSITKVEVFVGNVMIGSDQSKPYEVKWNNMAPGTHALRAVAYDNSGMSATSFTVTVTVKPSVQPDLTGLAFEAIPDQGAVILQWSAQTETMVATYRISRSSDSTFFQSLTDVTAVGTSNTPTSYDEIDFTPLTGVSWYRLEAYGVDGSLLAILDQKVDLSAPKVVENWVIYPNPLTGNQPIQIWALLTQNVMIEVDINDVFGKPVLKQSYQFVEGQNKLVIGLNTLSPGMYFFTLRNAGSGEVIDTKVFVKLP